MPATTKTVAATPAITIPAPPFFLGSSAPSAPPSTSLSTKVGRRLRFFEPFVEPSLPVTFIPESSFPGTPGIGGMPPPVGIFDVMAALSLAIISSVPGNNFPKSTGDDEVAFVQPTSDASVFKLSDDVVGNSGEMRELGEDEDFVGAPPAGAPNGPNDGGEPGDPGAPAGGASIAPIGKAGAWGVAGVGGVIEELGNPGAEDGAPGVPNPGGPDGAPNPGGPEGAPKPGGPDGLPAAPCAACASSAAFTAAPKPFAGLCAAPPVKISGFDASAFGLKSSGLLTQGATSCLTVQSAPTGCSPVFLGAAG